MAVAETFLRGDVSDPAPAIDYCQDNDVWRTSRHLAAFKLLPEQDRRTYIKQDRKVSGSQSEDRPNPK